MGSNSFGTLFRITTWGESHGPAIGVVIDGCPANLPLSIDEISAELLARRPGSRAFTSPRKERDEAQILSGIFEGKTTGAPISILISNTDAQSRSYDEQKDLLRPGHANFTYLHKYGIFDHRGGGRASARETACRVAAGAVAKKLLAHFDIACVAYLKAVGEESFASKPTSIASLKERRDSLFCPDPEAGKKFAQLLEKTLLEKDSVGGIVECFTSPLPIGLGDPLYEKLEANLAKAMLSLPATKGFEIGSGFEASRMRGSQHNDTFVSHNKCATNRAGGTLGGISTGEPLLFRVAFKPASSIRLPQKTVDTQGQERILQMPDDARHDPCVAIRAVPVIEAMTALVLADALLMQRSARI